MMAPMPVLMASMSIITKSQTLLTEKEFAAYGRAGAIAEEVLASIRTVVAFGGQKKELEKYCSELKDAKKNSIVKGTIGQSSMGLMFGLIYCAYGLGFWYGNKLIQDYREGEEYLPCIMNNCVTVNENNS